MPRTVLTATLAAALWLSCAPLPQPQAVPVVGAEEDLSILVGDWWGEYTSADTGRDGRIRFSLTADGLEARGDVLMFPALDPGSVEPQGERATAALGGQTLAIRFVRLRPGDETVTGTLEPYRDPSCDCLVTTTFTGRLSRDSIAGTFETRGGAGYRPTGGRWRVDRRPPDD